MKKKPYIYCLKDPTNQMIRYIGKTVQSKHKRLSSHYRDKKPSHKKSWIDSLKKKKLKPILAIIEWCDDDNWQEKEKKWIAYYRNKIGNKLTNILEGGNGLPKGYKHSAEAIEKIRIAGKRPNKGQFKKGKKTKKSIVRKIAESNKKKILQYDINGDFIREWKSATDAAKELKIHIANIQSVLRNKTYKAGNFIFRYYEENFSTKIELDINTLILQYDLTGKFIKIWSSAAEIERQIKISRVKMWNLLNNKSKQGEGFLWKYYSKNYPLQLEMI